MNEDLSSILEKLNIDKSSISPDMINNVMNMFNNKSDENSNTSNDESTNNTSMDIDIETLLKIKSVMDKINSKKDNPRARLLQDLKPYLNKEKQNKLEQYMKMDKIVDLLPMVSGDSVPHLYNDNQALLFSLIALLF